MRVTRIGLCGLLALVSASVITVESSHAVDRSCLPVQTLSAEKRVHDLGPAGGPYKPVLEAIRQEEQRAIATIKPTEDRWKALVANQKATIRAASPGASDAAVDTKLDEWVRRSAVADGALADQLRAQYTLHVAEMNQVAMAHQIPVPENDRAVANVAGQYASQQALPTNVVASMKQSQSFRHLVSDVAAASIAASSPQAIPAAPLARIGFDVRPDEVEVEVAAKAAGEVLVRADAENKRNQLILSHLRDFTGDPAARRDLMRDASKKTTKEIAVESAMALTGTVQSQEAYKKLQHIEFPANEPTHTLPQIAAKKIQETVKVIDVYIYGAAPPNLK